MSSVLAMMFLVIFGSLAVAMAVVAQGNLRTADSSIKVSRGMSAAETGLTFAARRLAGETRRFVVEKGLIDTDFCHQLWMGTYDTAVVGSVTVLPPVGYTTAVPPRGIVEAVRDAHLADGHDIIVVPGDASLPEIDPTFGSLRVRPIALSSEPNAPYFRLRYELLANDPMIRVTSEGHDGDVTRVLQMDFELDKKIEFAILSPNRIMIGKNVIVEGPVGSRFGIDPGELDTANGDPLVLRSDYYDLDPALDLELDGFFEAVVASDVDGDARLRPDHPVEGLALVNGVGIAGMDHDGNEFVDDFDFFMAFYDANSDLKVVYDHDLALANGHGSLTEEFADIDDQLARLIDETRPDRDGDGAVTASDHSLGYQDGVLDLNDVYSKIHGRLAFAVARAAWEAAHGESYQTVVKGSVIPEMEDPPVEFEVDSEELLELTTDMFNTSHSWFEAQVPNDPPANPVNFDGQVSAGVAAGGTFTPAGAAPWESVPFGSEGAYDYYQRPIYEDITFTNIRLPMGNNGLYRNCIFVGVTFVESFASCGHENWNYAGAYEQIDNGMGGFFYELKFPDLEARLPDNTPVPDTRAYSNSVRFEDCTFLGSVAGDSLDEYTHWRNKIQMTGNTRFYIDPTDPELLAQPDAALLASLLNAIPLPDREELAKSSILMPGWSVDVGNFTNLQAANPLETPTVQLRGTMVAGILDVRGTADVFGTLLMTFRPVEAQGPLFYGGQADAFNTTIGYFGPADGDNEGVDPGQAIFEGFGEIRLRYNADTVLPDGIPWPMQMAPDPTSYVEGGA